MLLFEVFKMMKELKADFDAMKLEIEQIKTNLQARPNPSMMTTAKEAKQ